jgi:hypothetical protein
MSSGNQVDRTADDAGTTMTNLITPARWPAPAPERIDTMLETLHQIDPADDITQEQIEAPRVKVLPPEFDQCFYPIGEPRTPGFRYCYAPVAQPGAVYCTEHKRLCRLRLD